MAIVTGSTVRIVKGCKALRIDAHTSARVTDVKELGAAYSHSVRVSMRFLNGFRAGRTVSLYARHINRLSDVAVRLNDGNPDHTVQVRMS